MEQKIKNSLCFTFIVALLLGMVIFPASPVLAAPNSINQGVSITIMYIKPGGMTSGKCSAWSNACDLQYGLTSAVSNSELWVKAGTYRPTATTNRASAFRLKNGVALYGGFVGTETNRTQRKPNVNATILSGDIGVTGDASDNSYHVVIGNSLNSSAVVDGFTITAGNANNSNPFDIGGGIYNLSSSLTLTNVIISNNSADDAGGGMYNKGGSPTLQKVTFNDNINVNGGAGGGLYTDGGSPKLMGVTFRGNSTLGAGGGMYTNGGSPTLTNVTFSRNSGMDGGGMSIGISDPLLVNVTFSNNQANVYGGGLYLGPGAYPTVHNSILWGDTDSLYNEVYSYDLSGTAPFSNVVIEGGCPVGVVCSHIIYQDPLLGTLGNYGGNIQTIPLLAGSSAIDTGDDSICPTTDERGILRPQGSHCDIGAFELVQHVISIISIAGQDGWVLETSETSNVGGSINNAAALYLGDDAAKKQYRSILSFNTGASLPDNAVITGVKLKVKQQAILGGGNPVAAFGGFMVDIKNGFFGTAPTLQASDFQAIASKSYGPFNTALVGGWYNIDLTSAKPFVNKLATGSGLTQIRLRFTLDDNNNAIANILSLYSGNPSTSSGQAAAAADRPQLVITYYVP